MPKKTRFIYGFIFLMSALICMYSYNLISLIIDPYRVVRGKINLTGKEQARFCKAEYLKNHPNINNGFIISNSRGFYVDAAYLSKLTGTKFYNFSVLADTPYSYLSKIEWLIKTQDVKHIVLFLSFDQFNMADSSFANHVTREHPHINKESWVSYYHAFSNIPDTLFKRRLADLLQIGHRIFCFMPSIGEHNPLYRGEEDIELDTGNIISIVHSRKERDTEFDEDFGDGERAKKLDKTLSAYLSSPFQQGSLTSLQQIALLLQKKQVKMTCVIPPISARALKLVDPDRYSNWITTLVKECGTVWDFSSANSITKNKDNYLEWSHFLLPVGNLMFEKIAGISSEKLSKHPDFGFLIDESNLSEYIQQWRASYGFETKTKHKIVGSYEK